ncbi:MAG TPA: tetratricopeptide repeat protein, partial [Steroidobacteraceae bacterium]
MPKRISLSLGALLACACACALPVLAAAPNPEQVYQALRAGNVAQAQQMMTQVLSEYPRVGRAHFVAAEVDARAGNYGLARQELRTAESLDPSLAAKDPRGVEELKQELGETPAVGVLAQQTVHASHGSRLGLFL